MRDQKPVDFINLGILIIAGICMLGGFWAYCETRFASNDRVSSIESIQKQMAQDIHEIYLIELDRKKALQE